MFIKKNQSKPNKREVLYLFKLVIINIDNNLLTINNPKDRKIVLYDPSLSYPKRTVNKYYIYKRTNNFSLI